MKDVIPLLTECFEAELDRDPAVGRINATAHLTIDSAADIGTVVAMGDLGGPSSLDAVKPVLLAQMAKQFGLSPRQDAALPELLAAA